MRYSKIPLLLVGFTLVWFGWTDIGSAALNFVTKANVGSGNGWHNQTVWSNPPNTTVSLPVAGNTYQMIANGTVWANNTGNTRMRNPPTDGLQVFPGDSLTLDTNTDIRFKRGSAATISATISSFPGVNGDPGLILNGGVLNPGDDSIFIVTGKVHVAAQSILSGGDNGGGAQKEPRAMYLRGTLTGSNNLVILQSGQATPHQTDADGSAYTGTWIVQCGFLKGLTPTSLGLGSIIVAPTNQLAAANGTNYAKVEFNYDWNTPGSLILSNNSISGAAAVCVLHQNVTVAALNINGTEIALGTYTWTALNSMYPANFPAGGSGQITVIPPGPPPAPLNVSAVGADSQVTLRWSVAANAQGYLIKRSDTDGGPYTTIGSSGGTNFVDVSLSNGSLYYYVVAATNSIGSSADSSQVIGAPNVVVADFVAVGGTNQVALSWTALSGATSYSLYSSTTPGGFTLLASGLTGTSYLDSTVLSARTYYYTISASLTGGSTSAPSAIVSGTTAPTTPTGFNARLFAATVASMGWTSSDPVVQFLIHRSTDGMNFSQVAIVPGTQRGYTNTGLSAATTYYYRVSATNAGGPTDYSSVSSVETPMAGSLNVNFQSGGNASSGALNSPTPPGFLGDIGDVFGNRTNGYSYGWTTIGGTNIVRDARWRQNPISPDLRYDTFLHLMKANTADPSVGAIWEIQVPNGPYQVHIVCGESDNADGVYIFDVEGILTGSYTPGAGLAHWGDLYASCVVNDGRLTIKSAAGSVNSKIAFVDIVPFIPVAPVIGTEPQSLTIEEYRPATFTVGLSAGSAPLVYQWYLGTTPVPGGTNATLSKPIAVMSDAGDYSVIVSNYSGSATSMVATLTIYPDTNAPSFSSIASLDGTIVGLCFNERMDNLDPSLVDNFSYTVITSVEPAGVNPDVVTLRPDGKSLALHLNMPISGAFEVRVSDGVQLHDLAGNLMAAAGSHLESAVAGFTAGDVGGPTLAGSHFTCDSNNLEIVGGGMDYWGMSDQAYLLTIPIVGDFEAKVRVLGLAGSNAVTKALLSARENRNADSRGYHVSLNPPAPARDQLEMGMRDATTGATVGVGNPVTPAGLPNGWLRLTRIGNTFTGYRSTNGQDWIALGTNTTGTPYPAAMSVGLGLTAHDNSLLATGLFSNLRITGLVGPLIQNETYTAGTFTAGFQSQNGFTYVVEYKNSVEPGPWTMLGGPIAGDGTVKSFTDPGPVSPSDHRIYRVSFR